MIYFICAYLHSFEAFTSTVSLTDRLCKAFEIKGVFSMGNFMSRLISVAIWHTGFQALITAGAHD